MRGLPREAEYYYARGLTLARTHSVPSGVGGWKEIVVESEVKLTIVLRGNFWVESEVKLTIVLRGNVWVESEVTSTIVLVRCGGWGNLGFESEVKLKKIVLHISHIRESVNFHDGRVVIGRLDHFPVLLLMLLADWIISRFCFFAAATSDFLLLLAELERKRCNFSKSLDYAQQVRVC